MIFGVLVGIVCILSVITLHELGHLIILRYYKATIHRGEFFYRSIRSFGVRVVYDPSSLSWAQRLTMYACGVVLGFIPVVICIELYSSILGLLALPYLYWSQHDIKRIGEILHWRFKWVY